jgi:acyl-CoA thioester hydrolase
MAKVSETQIRVRYQETDNMGVVYYANYLTWFEVARTDHLRSFGISYRELEKKGLYLMVVSVDCQYKSPARYDDVVRIETWVSEMKNTSITFDYKLFVKETLAATGRSVHVFTTKKLRPTRIPEEIRSLGII